MMDLYPRGGAERPAAAPAAPVPVPGPATAQVKNAVNDGSTRGRRKDPRKTTVGHQARFLASMTRSFARRLREQQGGGGEDTTAATEALTGLQVALYAALAQSGPALTRALAEYAKAEDPGVGLPALLALQEAVTAAVGEVGRDLTAQVGPAQVAVDLQLSTGQRWTRQRVFNRWGKEPQQPAAPPPAGDGPRWWDRERPFDGLPGDGGDPEPL